jgi:hypothetical protein
VFGADATYSCVFEIPVPWDYSGAGLVVEVLAMGDGAASGAVNFQAAAERHVSGSNLTASAFGTARPCRDQNMSGSANVLTLFTIVLSHADLGSPSRGDAIRLALRRVFNDGYESEVAVVVVKIGTQRGD